MGGAPEGDGGDQTALQAVIGGQACIVVSQQPALLPGVVANELIEPLGDEAATHLQQNGGFSQLITKAGRVQGQIVMADGSGAESQLGLHIGQQGPAQCLGQPGHGVSLLRIADLAGHQNAALLAEGHPLWFFVYNCGLWLRDTHFGVVVEGHPPWLPLDILVHRSRGAVIAGEWLLTDQPVLQRLPPARGQGLALTRVKRLGKGTVEMNGPSGHGELLPGVIHRA